MSDELYCEECGFAIDPQCLCKIPATKSVEESSGNAVRAKRRKARENKELPVHDAGPYRDPSTGKPVELDEKPARVVTSHKDCDHESTKPARAACRKARAAAK